MERALVATTNKVNQDCHRRLMQRRTGWQRCHRQILRLVLCLTRAASCMARCRLFKAFKPYVQRQCLAQPVQALWVKGVV